MKKGKYYKWRLDHDEVFHVSIYGHDFENGNIKLTSGGQLTVKAGFAWNGASPKFRVLGLEFGTMDGAIDQETFKSTTYHATLIHDALFQCEAIPSKAIDKVFLSRMKSAGFPLARPYYLAVRLANIIRRR